MLLEEKIKSAIRDVIDYPKPGIVFKDITPVLANPDLLRLTVDEMAKHFRHQHVDAIAAVEARGFILGGILARELNCSFIPVRKVGKLPYTTVAEKYTLEYGTAAVEMHVDAIQKGWNVLVHDDLLATGGTAAAAARLVKQSGGLVAGFSFLINLSFLPGYERLSREFGVNPDCLVTY
ncbi:MAG: adenine phosphoribosyltransferase [Cyclobacteriaceae bacterium]|nr:adenine phosphoribosyltransferase [Cyclobacteriaceae bacterium]UYN86003.1 MAG: adenine phosphoribosyltransferase [Cyclobacteriaceae bacterium]